MEKAFDMMDQVAPAAAIQQLTPNSSASDEHNPIPAGTPKILASCNLCRRRKVKCDRGNPCSNCLRSGMVCVSSTISRVPRGRQGGRRKPDAELLKRIANLENLVMSLENETGGVLPAAVTEKATDAQPALEEHDREKPGIGQPERSGLTANSPKSNLDRYLSSSFWITLSEEIGGLREILDDPSDDECENEGNKHVAQENAPASIQGSPSSFPIFGSSALASTTSTLQHPSLPQVHTLCSIFLANVDRVFKVLHAPSLRRYLHGQVKDLDCSPGPRGLEALKFAIYYAAVTTLTAEQCMTQVGEERSVLLAKYRLSVEAALARADMINTVEISTLQALVIFLVAVRSNDTTRFAWTVLSLAIRIANALGLHREESFASLRPFHKEMRRRLWWQIFILDEQGAQDRGSDPIITKSSFNTRRPLHVNDEDLTPEGLEEPEERKAFTDITFSSICHEVAEAMILLNFVPPGEAELAHKDIAGAWDQRMGLVINTQRRIQDKYLRYCDLNVPFHYATSRVADITIATLWLLLYRPLQKHVGYSTSLQPTHPNILHLSTKLMEKALEVNTNIYTESLHWLSNNYTQWHALAIALAELCVQTEGPTVERAWSVVEAIFAKAEQTVADSNRGMLWSPIRKLARRARAARRQHLQTGSVSPYTRHFSIDEAPSAPTHNLTPNKIGQGPEITDALPMAASEDYFPSSSAPTFDWSGWFQPDGSGFELDVADTNQIAWASWEGFVNDLHAPGDLMQG